MRIYIPEFTRSPYSLIVLGSVLIGLVSASLLMKSVKARKQTIFYTDFLVIVSTVVMAVSITPIPEKGMFQLGFSGLGGVLGLVLAVVISCFIHKDHPVESCAAYIISAPLMYSLSKFGCLFAGCCHGRKYRGPLSLVYHHNIEESYFPNQLVDIISFMVVYLILLFLFFKVKDKFKVIIAAFSIMVPVRYLVEYLRESNGDKIISLGQVKTLLVGLVSIVLVIILWRFINNGKQRSNI